MIFLGLISLLQIWFLPGFLFTHFFKKLKFIDKVILAFPLSIILNYIIVFAFLLFNFYENKYFLLLIFFEILLLIKILKIQISALFKKIPIKIKNKIELSLINIFLFFLFITFVFLSINSIGEITHPGDPLVMWDNWAKQFATNQLPKFTLDYPQAYPILMSITYVTMGNIDIEFFSRSVCLIYPLLVWLIFLRAMYILPKFKYEIKLTLLFSVVLFLNQFRHTLYIGFVDPILVFATVSLGYIFLIDKKYKFYANREIILIALIGCLPGLLKQTSLYLTILFPLIYLIYGYKFKNKINLKNIFFIILVISIVVLPWYVYKFYAFNSSEETFQAINLSVFNYSQSEVRGILGQQISNIFLNIFRALNLVFGKGYILILPLILFGLRKNFIAKISLFLIIVPYFVLWSNIFANDARNFSFLLPVVGLVVALGVSNLIFLKNQIFLSFKIKNIINISLITLLIFSFTIILNKKRNKDVLYKKQFEKELVRTNYPNINILLYNYFNEEKMINSKIIMYDLDFIHLPKFEKSLHIPCSDASIKEIEKIINEEFFYLLKKSTCSYNFLNFYNNIKNKKEIFSFNDHILWKNN
tara:strand:+ start:7221 stop:8981 length:1761 start_codon:yes stop_codon:yes gene_type:complete